MLCCLIVSASSEPSICDLSGDTQLLYCLCIFPPPSRTLLLVFFFVLFYFLRPDRLLPAKPIYCAPDSVVPWPHGEWDALGTCVVVFLSLGLTQLRHHLISAITKGHHYRAASALVGLPRLCFAANPQFCIPRTAYHSCLGASQPSSPCLACLLA
jgi:hypothetical protein